MNTHTESERPRTARDIDESLAINPARPGAYQWWYFDATSERRRSARASGDHLRRERIFTLVFFAHFEG